MYSIRTKQWCGFTLVELMLVVVILGILASVALVTFTRHVRRSKTSEAMHNVEKIYHGQLTYIGNAQERTSVSSFANAPPTPAGAPGAAKYPANSTVWSASSEWSAINFSLDVPHYYQYASPGDTGAFTARAIGNLDNDSTQSTFDRVGTITASGEVQGALVAISHELE